MQIQEQIADIYAWKSRRRNLENTFLSSYGLQLRQLFQLKLLFEQSKTNSHSNECLLALEKLKCPQLVYTSQDGNKQNPKFP